MKLVIDIDEEDFEIMKHNIAVNNPLCPLSQEEMVCKVANGIPLPKGHGKIVDANRVLENGDNWEVETALMQTEAIIEADNAGSEEQIWQI